AARAACGQGSKAYTSRPLRAAASAAQTPTLAPTSSTAPGRTVSSAARKQASASGRDPARPYRCSRAGLDGPPGPRMRSAPRPPPGPAARRGSIRETLRTRGGRRAGSSPPSRRGSRMRSCRVAWRTAGWRRTNARTCPVTIVDSPRSANGAPARTPARGPRPHADETRTYSERAPARRAIPPNRGAGARKPPGSGADRGGRGDRAEPDRRAADPAFRVDPAERARLTPATGEDTPRAQLDSQP